jgi:prolyl-tRNA editing enzyme YbaK/EbsC (Cys-tRNA(Pro) deacylase)
MCAPLLGTEDVQAFIEENELHARLIRDIGHTPTVPKAAEALGVHPDQIVKTLLFLVSKAGTVDDEPQPIVVISNGTSRVDKKALAAYFGVGKKRVKLAPPQVVLQILGFPAGGVPPVAHRTSVPVILDQSVIAVAERFDGLVYAGGGDDVTMMEVTVADIRRCLQPEILVVSADP